MLKSLYKNKARSLAKLLYQQDFHIQQKLDAIDRHAISEIDLTQVFLSVDVQTQDKLIQISVIRYDDVSHRVGRMEPMLEMSAIRLKNHQYAILVGNELYRLYRKCPIKEFFNVMLMHEVGHVLAGHLDSTDDDKTWVEGSNYEPDTSLPDNENIAVYYRLLAQCLLKGGVIPAEYEADCYAMDTVGFPAVMSLRAYDLSTQVTVGAKLELINRMERLTDRFKNKTPSLIEGVTIKINKVKHIV